MCVCMEALPGERRGYPDQRSRPRLLQPYASGVQRLHTTEPVTKSGYVCCDAHHAASDKDTILKGGSETLSANRGTDIR